MKRPSRQFRMVAALAATSAMMLSACSTTTATSSTSDPVTIEYWHVNTKAFGADTVNALVKKFNDTHPGITVEAKANDGYSNLTTALQAAVVAGNPPDVAQIGYSKNRYIAENFPVVSMKDLGVSTSGYPENILSLGKVNGTQVAMPYGLSVLQVYYNADLFKRAGIDTVNLPRTWEQWTAAAEQMKAATGIPLINFQQFPGDNFIPQAMVGSNGGTVLSCVKGSPKATFDSPEGDEAIGLMGSLAHDKVSTNLSSDQALQSFLGGQTATLITSSASRANLESQASFTLGATSFPTFGDKPLSLPAGGNDLFSFSTTDAKKKASKEFIEFLTTDPSNVDAWVKGTGYLPALEGAAAEYTASNPLQKKASESTKYLTPWVSFPGAGGLKASQTMYDATQAIIGGTSSAADALTVAARQINDGVSGATCG